MHLSWSGHVSRHDTLLKTILHSTVEGVCRRETAYMMEGQHQGVDRPVTVVAAALCGWATITAEAFVSVHQRHMGAIGLQLFTWSGTAIFGQWGRQAHISF